MRKYNVIETNNNKLSRRVLCCSLIGIITTSTMASKPQRTYSSKRNRKPAFPPSSPVSALSSSPPPATSRKRLFDDLGDLPQPKRVKKKPQEKQKTLTQLHFCIDQPILRTCPLCELSYTKGAPEDESLHRAHCARVQRTMEWGREEAREAAKAGVEEVAAGVTLKNGQKGRIICIRATAGGKIGAKVGPSCCLCPTNVSYNNISAI